MAGLQQKILAQIAEKGPIAGDMYMQACLADPDFGYYMGKDPFGQAGDFTTAPEISQVFGEILGGWAVYIAENFLANAHPDQPIHVIEMGPGRGTLMSDMLRIWQMRPALCRQLHVHMIEISPARQQQQQIKLAPQSHIASTLSWHQDLSACVADIEKQPKGLCLFIANELIDAFPIQQWRYADQGWQMRHVTEKAGKLHWCWGDGQTDSPDLLSYRDSYPVSETEIYETCPQMVPLVTGLSDLLKNMPGIALLIDYGYGESQAGDSLQALKNHEFHDPLVSPGQADITAHVDFAAIQRVAKSHSIQPFPLMSQGQFLQSLGINMRLQQLAQKHPEKADRLLQAGQRLYHPDAMGDLFKIQALTTPKFPIFPPFSA